MTSSIVAIHSDHKKSKLWFSEKDWTVVENVEYYTKSKVLAEKAAWEIYEANKNKLHLTIICPSLVVRAGLSGECLQVLVLAK